MKSCLTLLSFVLLPSFFLKAQNPIPVESGLFKPYSDTTWNKNAIERVADVGRLWGVVKYFHPEIIKGKIDPDRLILDNIDELLKKPSKINYVMTINGMLRMLHDPSSKIEMNSARLSNHLFPLKEPKNKIKGLYIIKAPQSLSNNKLNIDLFQLAARQNNKYIIDLRNELQDDELGLKQYKNMVQPLVAGIIDHTLVLPTIRTAYYHAMLRQDFPDDIDVIPAGDRAGDPNYWYQERFGLKNTSQGAYLLTNGHQQFKGKKFCFIVNRNNDSNTLKALLALKNRNQCFLIFDGPIPDYLLGDYYKMEMADGIRVKIKIAEQIYEDGTTGLGPDKIVDYECSQGQQSLLDLALSLFDHSPALHINKPEVNVLVRLPQQAYNENLYPETKLRLLALFNFWNVIHYFCPNKKLIRGSWEQGLNYFIPRFIFAKDYKSYYWMLREISAKLNDGHAEITKDNSILPPKGIADFYTPIVMKYIEGKTIVAAVVGDSMQVNSLGITIGDEVTSIDNIPIKELYDKWRGYVGGSNEPNYFNPLHKIPLASRAGAKRIKITLIRGKEIHVVNMNPVSQEEYLKVFSTVYYPNIPAPFWKSLNDSTGYVRINSIYSNQVDSMWLALKDKRFIILDARGYPRDNEIIQKIVAPFLTKTDTVCINHFPEISHPMSTRNGIMIEHETISPSAFNIKVPHNKKFVLLCNVGNASQAETNIISLQNILRPITIGTQTVGANGVSNTILLPGGYKGHYSGYAVYYPDGTPNQQLGVKIDIPVKITIDGLIEGKDEIFDKGYGYITGNP